LRGNKNGNCSDRKEKENALEHKKNNRKFKLGERRNNFLS
jgi:hypothetical protein